MTYGASDIGRLIETISRESLDRIIVFGEAHLRHILEAYVLYYNDVRTHLSLDKNADFRRPSPVGAIATIPILGGVASPMRPGLGFAWEVGLSPC